MKQILLMIAGMFTATTFAQIPNSGFESWATAGSYSLPASWGTMNNTTATFSVYTATPGTPGSPGLSYLKLTSKTTGSTVTNGIAVSGVLDSITMKPKSGFACTLQPVSFTGKWQHMIYGSSQGSVKAVLTKWNSSLNKRDTIAVAAQTLSGMAMSWANFSINFNYTGSGVPDSCIIELKASGSNPTNNDYLWVDNLAFSGTITGIDKKESAASTIHVFPNPSNGKISIAMNTQRAATVTLQLSDVTGKLISEKKLTDVQANAVIDLGTADMARGTYFLKVITDKSTETKKIIID
jgi:hypothetical protein